MQPSTHVFLFRYADLRCDQFATRVKNRLAVSWAGETPAAQPKKECEIPGWNPGCDGRLFAPVPTDRPRAITRGRNFLLKDALTFAILDAEQTQPKAAFADQGNKYTGFRVALPAPLQEGK